MYLLHLIPRIGTFFAYKKIKAPLNFFINFGVRFSRTFYSQNLSRMHCEVVAKVRKFSDNLTLHTGTFLLLKLRIERFYGFITSKMLICVTKKYAQRFLSNNYWGLMCLNRTQRSNIVCLLYLCVNVQALYIY